MPLLAGKKNIGRNIKELEQHGSRPRSHKQILAIVLDVARRSGANIPKKRMDPKLLR
jgi:hypothetical protein